MPETGQKTTFIAEFAVLQKSSPSPTTAITQLRALAETIERVVTETDAEFVLQRVEWV